MATMPERRVTMPSKPTMSVSPKPKLLPLPKLSPKPDSPLKPESPLSPKPRLSPKPLLSSKSMVSLPISRKAPPETPPKPLSPKPKPVPPKEKPASPQAEKPSPPAVILRPKVSKSGAPDKKERLRRRYSLAVMSNVAAPETASSSSHDLRRDIERKGEDIWKTYCRNPPGYPTLFPPVPQLPAKLRDKLCSDKEDAVSRYQCEATVYRALANLPEDLVVLQGFEFTHQEFGLYVNHECDKTDTEVEGGCDFVAIGENHVVILDVRSMSLDGDGAGDLFLENFKESAGLRAKVSKLALRIIIKTFRFKMPTIRQFTVFPNISKSECEKLPQFATLSDAEKGNLLFSNELTTWWASQNKADKVKIKKDKEFHVALQRVKQTLIGIWSMDRENVSGTGNCGLGKNLTRVEALLDGRKTVEIEDFVSAISKLSNKDHSSELNGRDEVDGGDDHQNMYGVKPVLHLVTRRVGHETVPLTTLISNILETDITNLADVDPATTAIVDVNTNSSSSLLASLESMSVIKGYDEVVASDWTAVTCVVDLSEVLRLSAMKAGQCQDLDTILVRMNSVFARVKSYLSVILIVGATEVMGDEQFDEFGKETLNKINRAYFLKTKTTLSNLVQVQVSQSCVKYYNTASSSSSSDCVQLPWAEIKKKLDSMFIFPEQRINKQVVILITTQIATVENHVLSIASKINTQKSATKNWIDKLGPGCRNDDLKRIKNTIDKLQEGITEMHELHGKLTTQLCDLSRMYQEVYEDVEANID